MARLKPLWLHLNDLAARLARSSSVALACDYDGTLTPIAEHPAKAQLSSRAGSALMRLSRLPDVHLAVLSGRGLDDLVQCIPVNGIFLAGVAGLETQDETGRRDIHVDHTHEIPPELRQDLLRWCERFEGAWLEDKNLAFALHYRAVKPELQAAFGAGVRRRVRPHQSRVVLVHGKRVFEVTPAVQRDKSVALVDWLARQRPETSSFYFGDDTNDEPVFDRVKDRGGVTVAVGRLASHAEYGVGSTEEVVWFLEWLEREWSLRAGAGEPVTA